MSSLAIGMQEVAETFCDNLVTLTNDVKCCNSRPALTSLFGVPTEGLPFLDMIAEGDCIRFGNILKQATGTRVP